MRFILCLTLIGTAACSSSSAQKLPDGGACLNETAIGDGTIASMAPIVVRTCAKAGCHDSLTHEHGMDLSTTDLIHQNWVGIKGLDHCSNMAVVRVAPGDPDGSFVMTKIRAPGAICSLGTRMPPPPADMLSSCEIESIRRWIVAGAPGPIGGVDAGDAGDVDAAGDAGDDASPDAPDPGGCTATNPCDPVTEICIESMPVATSDNCYTRWECYTHAPPDDGDTVQHACPPEIATFCACDGTMFEVPYACPNRPYDHVGACGDGYSCDIFRVRCADPEPTCPDGQVPAVVSGCWGPCVAIAMCRCDQNWQCPMRDIYRCSVYPVFRCGPIPPPRDGGTDGSN